MNNISWNQITVSQKKTPDKQFHGFLIRNSEVKISPFPHCALTPFIKKYVKSVKSTFLLKKYRIQSVEITEIYCHVTLFWQKFRESNVFTKENIKYVTVNFSFFHPVFSFLDHAHLVVFNLTKSQRFKKNWFCVVDFTAKMYLFRVFQLQLHPNLVFFLYLWMYSI